MTRDELDTLTLKTLITALNRGDIIQVYCREVSTGKEVSVIGIFIDSQQLFVPLARLYGPTAYQEVYPPEIDFNAPKQQAPQEIPA